MTHARAIGALLLVACLVLPFSALGETSSNDLKYSLPADTGPISIDLAQGIDKVKSVTLSSRQVDKTPETTIQHNKFDMPGFKFDGTRNLFVTPGDYNKDLVFGETKKVAITYSVQSPDNQVTSRTLTVTIRGVNNASNLCSDEATFSKPGRFCYNLLVGAEGTSVKNVNSKANVRSEFIAYERLTLAKKLDLHIWGSTLFASTGEQSKSSGQRTSVEANINLGLFTHNPWVSGGPWLGFIAYSGLRKDVNGSEFAKRYYAGPRLARNPNQYIDILYGKTEGVMGERMEVRAQIPIGNVFLGMVLNHSVRNGPPKGQGADSVKLYFLAPVDITSIFTSIAK